MSDVPTLDDSSPRKRDSRYVVGIDLGTTNCAISSADLAAGDPAATVRDLKVRQLVARGEVQERSLLPSFLYLPLDGEDCLPEGSGGATAASGKIAGVFARTRGSEVPGRLVSSAKSWLCHPGVDRNGPILPWGAPPDVPRISPVDASAAYLAHLARAWEEANPGLSLKSQEVILTVPASFDQAARMLTLEAAERAGIGRPTLLEEPLAAFYDWTRRHRGRLDKALGDNRTILVVDVGGGTTDLTLISVQPGGGAASPALKRLSVGRHLLLGGDNMDVAIARLAESKIGEKLDSSRWSALLQSARNAKEQILSPDGPDEVTISVASRGSRLVGSTRSVVIKGREIVPFLLDGFFPQVSASERPAQARRMGLQEAGLPYESDPAITRHVAAFLSDHAGEVAEGASFIVPDAVLLNGGVFCSEAITRRLLAVIDSWRDRESGEGRRVNLLDNDALDLAVSRGAVSYGLVRRGLGLRVGGGSPRAYFIGVDGEDSGRGGGEAKASSASRGICIVPRHLDEDVEVEIPRTFRLLLDHPARFSLHASNQALDAKPGDMADLGGESFTQLPPIETVLKSRGEPSGKGARPSEIPVRLKACLTEIGTLELWCVEEGGDGQKWKLEFGLRGGGRRQEDGATEVAPMPRNFQDARDLVEMIFGKKPAPVDKRDVKNLTRELEKILGPRSRWSTPVIRELWAALHAGMGKRRRTADHERLWCNLVGFCLRPGFGAPLDAWRAEETFKAFGQGLQFQKEPHNWEAWWVMWRRIAGGLSPEAQTAICDSVMKSILPPAKGGRQRQTEGLQELIRMAASLECVPPSQKVAMGEGILHRMESEGAQPHLLWAIGRLGARVPFHGGADTCVPVDVAESWVERVIRNVPENRRPDAAFPLVQLARLCGDRSRDLSPECRAKVERFLRSARCPEESVQAVTRFVPLSSSDDEKRFGESLPEGLKLQV